MDVAPLEDAAKSLEEASAQIGPRFIRGVKRAKMKDAAIAGQGLYVSQMSSPTILARRQKGLEKITDEEWRAKAEKKGGAVIGGRVKDAIPDWKTGFAPFRAALEATTLPARTADPMTNLTQRAGAAVQALVNKKKELLGES